MKKHFIILLIIVVSIFTGCSHGDISEEKKKTAREYDCDYHTFSLNTCITYEKDGEEYEISGDILHIVTDPLVLKKGDTVIGRADDSYKIVGQDDHAIIINGNFEVDIVGDFEVFGESYDLYDQQKNKIGYAAFGTLCLDGAVYNADDEVIAEYSRWPLMNDYDVTIYDNNVCSDEAIMMIIASYVSDYHADRD